MLKAEFFFRDAKIYKPAGLIQHPKVSVVLPTYCRGDNGLLARAIDSVLSQKLSDLELIVVDDGSTDGTADVVSDYLKSDDRVIHVRHAQNSGLPALRVNEALLMARADICAYQFDDDQWVPTAMESLVGALEQHPQFDVAYGKCLFHQQGESTPLGSAFNYSQLIGGNYIANNSLIHRRSVFERFGGYDMHLVMRRLCDWDLWLRWGKKVRFLFVDEVVSLVEAAVENSLGTTVSYDSFTARAHMSKPRDHLLVPEKLNDYPLDNLDHLAILGEHKVAEVWRQQIATFRSRHRHLWTAVQPKRAVPLHVLVVKAHYDTTVDITINNFTALLAGEFHFTFVPELQVDKACIDKADILLLHRTVDDYAVELADFGRALGKAVVFLMDDDLFSIYEVSPEFSYLAPGADYRIALENMVAKSDLAVTYSRLMQDSISQFNPRNVRLETNVPAHRLERAKQRSGEPENSGSAAGQPLKIAFAGGGARKEEFAVLWPAVVAISKRLQDKALFSFWGFAPEAVNELASPYNCEPFTFSYEEYLDRLMNSGFDIMIAPLFAEQRAKKAKCPIKFLECTVAGAIGVYSNVEPYAVVEDGVTGIKSENDVHSWTAALSKAVDLSCAQRKTMLGKALCVVESSFTSEIQASWVAATLEAALCHSRLKRPDDSKARIAYFCHSPHLGGAENHLLRHALIAKLYAFEPILVLPLWASDVHEEMQRRATDNGIRIEYLPLQIETEVDKSRKIDTHAVSQIADWLKANDIALVHSVTLMREVGAACRSAGIGHVASLYATSSVEFADIDYCDQVHSDSLIYTNQWATVLGAPARCILSAVPETYFSIGRSRTEKHYATTGAADERMLQIGLFGTVQPRKGQLQSIEAMGLLARDHGIKVCLNIYGYDHFFPEYISECLAMAAKYSVGEQLSMKGFVSDTAAELAHIDIVLCASDWESLPQVILEGMAARSLIVAPKVGGIAEVISNTNGILLNSNASEEICAGLLKAVKLEETERNNRLDRAFEVVLCESSRDAVAKSLFKVYGDVAQVNAARNAQNAQLLAPSAHHHSSDAQLLKTSLERIYQRLSSATTINESR
jgi:glycosyltransferase involved in cell wall biosynthesis